MIGSLGAPATVCSQEGPASVPELVKTLGHDDYAQREAATRQLLNRGPEIVPQLREALDQVTDPEVRHRLRYVLENIAPPPQGVLLIHAADDTGLQPGDVITHLNSQPVRNHSDLRQRLAASSLGSYLRVRGEGGPREVGPVSIEQLYEMRDYVAPRGETIAKAVRLYAGGFAEQAYELLADELANILEAELSKLLIARIAYTAGDATAALTLLSDRPECVRPLPADSEWNSPSYLDLAGPGKAPFQLEWEVATRAGQELYASDNDPDLRIQRVLVPAGRFADALVAAARFWWDRYRHNLGDATDANRVAGNQLAVAGWMLFELGLRSECCRLIEPRSAILRASSTTERMWVRVDTDAWLPFLAGDARAALDSFYEVAFDILQRPPGPNDARALIRSPNVAARVAFFLYQNPGDPRIDDTLQIVGHPSHPVLTDYLDWMLYALRERNQDVIRQHLQSVLPQLDDQLVLPYARAVALLEYVQKRPDVEVLRAARQRIFDAAEKSERRLWLAITDAIVDLSQDRPDAARETLAPFRDTAEAGLLYETASFMSAPPPAAANHAALEQPILATPIGTSGDRWLVLARDRRLMIFDATANLLTALDRPTPSWFPNPLTWPWIGREHSTGRVWVYGRRRLIEVRTDEQPAIRLNLRTAQILAFERFVAPHFSSLAKAVSETTVPPGENGEFLRADVSQNAEYFADPDLPDVGMIRELPNDPRVLHVALRGGPHLLIDVTTGRSWTSVDIQQKLGLDTPPTFFAQALQPGGAGTGPDVFLMGTAGPIRFELATESMTRLELPGPQPHASVIPESAPYVRRDPRYVYCARVPADGGQVYRLDLAANRLDPVDMINLALPEHYYDIQPRSVIRAELGRLFTDGDMPDLQGFIESAAQTVAEWDEARSKLP